MFSSTAISCKYYLLTSRIEHFTYLTLSFTSVQHTLARSANIVAQRGDSRMFTCHVQNCHFGESMDVTCVCSGIAVI